MQSAEQARGGTVEPAGDERKGDRRREILAAVYRLVARGGIESVRTNAVAREAGVSSALIFYYFGTRQELLRKAFDYVHARTETPGLRGDHAESPAIETIERTLLGQVDNAKVVRENWVLWSEMSAAALFDPSLRDAVNVAAERWVGCVRELILTGQDEGSIPRSVDSQAAAERLTGVTDSLGTKWLTGGLSSERTRELVRGAIELELGVVLKGSKRTGTPR